MGPGKPLVHGAGKHLPDGVDSVVASETLGPQASQRSDYLGLVEGELVLDDGVDNRVQLRVGQPNSSAAVERLDQADALALVEFEPRFRIKGMLRVVLFQLFTLPNGSRLSCGRARTTLAAPGRRRRSYPGPDGGRQPPGTPPTRAVSCSRSHAAVVLK